MTLEFQRRDITEAALKAADGAHSIGQPDADGWEQPVPFNDSEVPAFPTHVLPGWLGTWARAEAEAIQAPVDVPAFLGLACVALAVAKKAEVRIHPDWPEPLNVYVVITLPSGDGKSPVFRHAMAPVYAYERERAAALESKIAEAKERRTIREERLKALRHEAATAKAADVRDKARAEAEELAAELVTETVPVAPRLTADDATLEAVGALLAKHGERLGVFSAEGGPFEILAGRYSEKKAPNIDLFLKAYNGDHCAVDRVGREGYVLHAPALTMALTVQTSVIAGLAATPAFRGKGLLARFMYAVPKSLLGTRDPDPPRVPAAVRAAYEAVLTRLLELPAKSDNADDKEPHALMFDDEARTAFIAFKARLEPQLGPGRELNPIADWGNKLAGTVARLAGLLHIADHAEVHRELPRSRVPASAVVRAVVIAEYLISHARAAFSIMGADPAMEGAKHVLAWLRRDGRATVTRRDIHRAMPTRFPKAAEVDPAIHILVERGYLRELLTERAGAGRPSARYSVHPNFRQI